MSRRRGALALALAAALLHGAVAWTLAGHAFFYGRMLASNVLMDVQFYYLYGSKALVGQWPYRDYRIEYPLLAFPLMLAPRLLAADLRSYRAWFALEMLLLDAALVAQVATWVARREGLRPVASRLAWYSACFLALCPVVLARFDLAPTALAFASAGLWFSGRRAAGGVVAGLGILVKIFPGVVAAPGLVADFAGGSGRRGRGVLALATTLAVGMLAWSALGGGGLAESVGYHLRRGIEFGSLPAGLLALVHRLGRGIVRTEFDFGSTELVGPGVEAVSRVAFPLQALALGLVIWRARRARLDDPMRWAGAAVVAFVAFGKVLSPQFLVWPMPFVIALEGPTGRRARPLYLALCLVTTAIYPWLTHHVVAFDAAGLLLLNARNLGLVALWLLLLCGPGAPDPGTGGRAAVAAGGIPRPAWLRRRGQASPR